MKAAGMLAVAALAISGCCRAYLEDERLAGVTSWYQGCTDPITLAQARQAMVITDRQDQLLAELVDSKTSEERRGQLRRDYQFLEATLEELNQPVSGWLENKTGDDFEVKIYRGRQFFAALRVGAGARVSKPLPPGFYQLHWTRLFDGRTKIVEKSVVPGQDWQSLVYPI